MCGKEYSRKPRRNLKWWAASKYCSWACSSKSKEGKPGGMLGKKQTEEAKSKIRSHKHTEEALIKIAEASRRRRKVGVVAVNLRANRTYRRWRLTILGRDGHTCQKCGTSNPRARLEIHHIKPFKDFPELRYEASNVTTLCRDCHKKTDTYGAKLLISKSILWQL